MAFLTPYRRDRGSPMPSLQHEINDLFESFWHGWDRMPGRMTDRSGWMSSTFDPDIDVSETKDEFLVHADLPGLDEKDVEVEVSGDMLTIRGEKKEEREDKGRSWHSVERSWGSFERAIPLPAAADTAKATASFTKGVLKVAIPKTAEAKTQARRLEIKKN